ncbi:hypothetical protein HU200_031482 [Digitaria exilis]|uniref:Glycosyl transferase CAP10 domain-containing protein n=1 Tax=Digitaria exilis TaxID=1010633 RepID=A0A835EPX7_9POAL|nr:hypothetical protein HU200_031482 [Digitaria exilis]
MAEGNAMVNWTDRAPYAYWKGNPNVGAGRRFLLRCNVSGERDWNARIYAQDWGKEVRQGFRESDLSKQCTHRYKIYIEGRGWSVSEKYILACDSMALMVRPMFHGFFSRGLAPLLHYWPVRDAGFAMCRSIKLAVDWGNSHTDKAREIGGTASRFVQEDLAMERVYDYMLHLLTESRRIRGLPCSPWPHKRAVALRAAVVLGCHNWESSRERVPVRCGRSFRSRATHTYYYLSSACAHTGRNRDRSLSSVEAPAAMATAMAADSRRRAVLAGVLSRTSAAFLFLSVAAVAAIGSARWITATTALQGRLTRLPTTAAILAAAAAEHPHPPRPSASAPSPPPPPRSPPPAFYSITCSALNLSHPTTTTTAASTTSQTLARALSSSSVCPSSPGPPPPASAAPKSSNRSCPSYFRFIHEDLRPWRAAGGITRAMLGRARLTATFRLVVLGGRAYVQRFRPAFQTRDLFTIWGVLQLLRRYPGRVPDLDLMFDTVDWPVVRTHLYRGKYAQVMPPLFRYCGDDRTLDIVFPDWSFWGWPEINIKPWDALQEDLKNGNNRVRWMDREPYAYWKGNPSVSTTRQELVKCNVSSTQDWNARIYAQVTLKFPPQQLAQRIGKQASNLIQEDLTMDNVYDYMLHLLTEYAKLLKFKPTRPPEAVEICSESLACQAEGLEKRFLVNSMTKSAHDAAPCDLPPPFSSGELKMLKQRKENSVKQIEMWEQKALRT